MQTLVKWSLFVLAAGTAIYYLSAVGFILSCFLLMYMLMAAGPREKGSLSAFSVFNPNFEAIPGTMTAADVDASMRTGMPAKVSGVAGRSNGLTREERIQQVLSRRRAYRSQNSEKNAKHGNRSTDAGEEDDNEDSLFEEVLYEKLEDRNTGDKVFKQKPNDLCACASGRKYKRCCALIDREIIPDYY